jgi:hydrogenase-4 component E
MIVLLFAGALLLLDGRASRVLVAYAVLALTTSVIIAPVAFVTPIATACFVVSTLLKVVLAPVGFVLFLRANPAAGDLRPSISLPLRLLLTIAFVFVAHAVARIPEFGGEGMIDVVAFLVLCGVGMLVVHRNLLADMIGLLAFGVAVDLAGAIFAPTLPESVELGATFDALVATFLGLTLVRSIVTQNPLLDVESLRRLRG